MHEYWEITNFETRDEKNGLISGNFREYLVLGLDVYISMVYRTLGKFFTLKF